MHKVACVGDSITYGLGVFEDRSHYAYPSILASKLGKKYLVRNYGVNGATACQGPESYARYQMFSKSQKFQADLYLIMLGTNDGKDTYWNPERFRQGLSKIANTYLNLASQPQVVLIQPIACYSPYYTDIRQHIENQDVFKNVEQVAYQSKVPTINLFDVTQGHPELLVDGIHPGKEGNQLIAKHIFQTLHSLNLIREEN